MSYTSDNLLSVIEGLVKSFRDGKKRIVVENAGGYRFGAKHIYIEENK